MHLMQRKRQVLQPQFRRWLRPSCRPSTAISMATDEDTSAAAGGDAELHGSVAAAAWHELCVQYNMRDDAGQYLTPRNNQLRAFAATMTGQNVLNVDAPGNGKTLSYIMNA